MIQFARLRLWLGIVVGLVVAVAVAFAVVHTPAVRARVLDLILARLGQAGVVARAQQLDYNLAKLDVRIRGLTLAAPTTPALPFLATDETHVVLGWGILRGHIEITRFESVHPRIVLVKDAHGQPNWPTSKQSGNSSIGRIDLGHVDIPDLDVAFRDDQARFGVEAGGVAIHLAPTIAGSASGTVGLGRPGSLIWRERHTTIDRVDGRLSWNGADLALAALRVALPEVQLAIDGRVDRALNGPSPLDLKIVADANLAAIGPWAQLEESVDPLGGVLHAETAVNGSTATPTAALTLTGRDIAAAGLEKIGLQAAGRASTDSVELTRLETRVGGGTITGRGRVSIPSSAGELRLDWRQLDLAALMRQLARDAPQLAARIDGSLEARWSAPRVDAALVHGEARTTAPDEEPDRAVPIDGTLALDLRQVKWTLRADEALDRGTVRVTADLSGNLSQPDLSRTTIAGGVHLLARDAARLTRTLARVGLVTEAPAIDGGGEGDFVVAGTVGDPELDGTLASQLRYAGVGPVALRAHAAATRRAVRLDEVEARLGANQARGAVGIAIDTRRLDGTLDVALHDLDAVSSALPIAARPAGALDAHASLSGSPTVPHVEADLTSTGLTAAGQHIDRADARIVVNGSAVAIERLRADSGEGRVEGNGRIDLDRKTYVAHATATNLPVHPVPDENGSVTAPVTGRLTGQFDGEGAFDRLDGRGRLLFADAAWGDAELGGIESDFILRGRRISLDLRAPELQLTASGEVGIDAASTVTARGRWEPADVTALARRLGWSPPFLLSGSGAVRFDVSGPQAHPDALHGTVDLDRVALEVDGKPVRLVRPSQVAYDGQAIRVREAELAFGESRLAITGSLGDASPDGLVATLQGSLGDFEFFEHLVGSADADQEHANLPAPAGAIAVRLAARGPLSTPVLGGTVQVRDGRVPLTPRAAVTDVQVSAAYEQGVLTVGDLRAGFEGATLTARSEVPADLLRDRLPEKLQALVPRAGRPATLTAQISSITQQAAAPFVDAATLQGVVGHIDAAIDLRADGATLDRVNGAVVLNRADLALSGVSFDQQIPTRLRVHDGRVDVDAWEWGRADNRIALTGGLSLAGDRPLALTAKTTLNLGLLNAFSRAARASGRADGEIRVGGTTVDPRVDGYLTFAEGEVRMSDPKVVVADLTGTVTFNRDAITLERMYAAVNGGATELGGTIHHRWFTPLDGQISMRARDAAIDVSGFRAEADADLAIALEPRGTTLSGSVTILRGAYREPLSLTGGLLQALRAQGTVTSTARRSTLDDVRLDVRIVTRDDLLVDNNYAQLDASADLRLIGTVAQPAATGRAALAEGGVVFFGGRRYRLAQQGSIDFANTTRIEPNLDLTAVTRVNNAESNNPEITLTLNGTPETMTPKLTSDNPMLTQADLISLLVTGRTDAERAAAGDYGGRELIGYLSADLVGAAGRVVGLDTLRVEQGTPDVRYDAGLVATEADPGARLTFGKNIGTRAQVVFSQSLRNDGGTTWIVTYSPRSRIELRAVSLDNNDRLYGFRHDIVLGDTSAAPRKAAAENAKVASVQIVGAGPDEAALRERLTLGPGDRFSFFAWQDDRDRMERFFQEHGRATARVTTRRVEGEAPDAQSVVLRYDVRPGPLTTVVVDGAAFPDRVIEAMKLAWTRAVVEEFLFEEVSNLARGEMLDRGFVRASATARLDAGPDARTLHVTIDPGPQVNHRRVVFRGNDRIGSDSLLAAIADPSLMRAVWLDPSVAGDALTALYRREGYLSAAVRFDEITIENNDATRVVMIDEGERYVVGDIRIAGTRAVSLGDVEQMASLSSATPFSDAVVDRARRAIVDGYRSRGYNNVGLTVRTQPAEGQPTVDVSFAIDEGSQQRLRDIAIAGLKRTNPELVRRALKLEAGEPVNLADWAASRQRLYETGVFRSVDVQPEAMQPQTQRDPAATTPPAEEPIRARVTLGEWPPVRLQYGLEIDDQANTPSEEAARAAPDTPSASGRIFGVGVAGSIGVRNLFGNAISTGVAARYTKDFQAARAYATAPTLFGRRIVTNAFVSVSREQVGAGVAGGNAKFATNTLDFTLEQRLRPFKKTEVTYRYTFERNHTFDLEPNPDAVIPFDVLATIARLASTVLIDSRNDLVDATRGWFHSSDFEYAVPALGSDVKSVKYVLQQRYYRRVGRVVLASALRVGLATAFDEPLLPSERFFAGGGNSVRGYDEDSLAPIDIFGASVGGNALLVLNEEVRFPIYKWVRGVGFFDAGRAFDKVSNMTLSDLPTGTGLGLRLQTPIVLLRLDAGVPLDTTLAPRRIRWFFSIGQTF